MAALIQRFKCFPNTAPHYALVPTQFVLPSAAYSDRYIDRSNAEDLLQKTFTRCQGRSHKK